MIELLALPLWNAPPRSLDDWINQLAAAGFSPTIVRESSEAAWLEVGMLRFRGYALLEGTHVTAVHFELAAIHIERAVQVIHSAARSLGWEVHSDDDDQDDEGDDFDDAPEDET